MVLSERPLSIFDIVGGDSDDDEDSNNVERPVETAVKTSGGEGHSNKRVRMLNKIDGHITSFRLPRGSSKLLHVHLWVHDFVIIFHFVFPPVDLTAVYSEFSFIIFTNICIIFIR